MISQSRSCSWCHHMNRTDVPAAVFCAKCGHRADVPRAECDCQRCKPNTDQRAEQMRLDRESMRYLAAVYAGDFDTITAMWYAAEIDAPLAEMMHGINNELTQEGEKLYRGRRFPQYVVVLIGSEPLRPGASRQIRDHSPTGFEWGYSGSGPAQLALAILLDVTGDRETAEQQHQLFKAQFVAGWGDTWSITEAEVRAWLGRGKTVCVE